MTSTFLMPLFKKKAAPYLKDLLVLHLLVVSFVCVKLPKVIARLFSVTELSLNNILLRWDAALLSSNLTYLEYRAPPEHAFADEETSLQLLNCKRLSTINHLCLVFWWPMSSRGTQRVKTRRLLAAAASQPSFVQLRLGLLFEREVRRGPAVSGYSTLSKRLLSFRQLSRTR